MSEFWVLSIVVAGFGMALMGVSLALLSVCFRVRRLELKEYSRHGTCGDVEPRS